MFALDLIMIDPKRQDPQLSTDLMPEAGKT